MMRACLRVLALFPLLICAPASTPQIIPKVSEAPPPLSFTEILQSPDGNSATWDALRGKAVVLEFWATWCGGCVANIPHINTLAAKFRAQPVLFISITDEEKPTILRFLKTHPINGWIALDAKRSTFDSYHVLGIPQTFLIDAAGKLRAITNPNVVNDGVIEDLLAGRALNIPQFDPAAAVPRLGSEPGAPAPVVQVLVRPAGSVDVSGFSPGARASVNGRYEAFGVTLREILGDAYDFPVSRIDAPDWCNETKFDVSVAVPHGGDADRWPLVQQVLATCFHLQVHRETRDTTVYVLRTLPGRKPNLRVSTSSETHSRPWGRTGEFEAVGVQMKTLVWTAGNVLDSEAFDETGLQGRYDFSLKWDPKNPTSIVSAIDAQLGLQLAQLQRKLEHLVIESAQEPTTW